MWTLMTNWEESDQDQRLQQDIRNLSLTKRGMDLLFASRALPITELWGRKILTFNSKELSAADEIAHRISLPTKAQHQHGKIKSRPKHHL